MQEVPTVRNQLLRIGRATAASGISRSGFYRLVKLGLMPAPIKLGPNSSAVPTAEVEAVNAAKIRGASDAEVRELVQQMHQQRNQAGVQP